jgi:hypothetical protein
MVSLLQPSIPSTWEALADAYQSRIQTAVEQWSRGAATDDDVQWLSWLVANELVSNRTTSSPKLEKLLAEYRAVESEIPAPRVVEGLADKGPGRDFPVLIGGNAKTFGDPAPRRLLRNILGDVSFTAVGSGRRELAERIASSENPLTARLMVNRIWQHVFGRGIVASVDGSGTRPGKYSSTPLSAS